MAQQPVDLSSDRIDRLSDWAKVAFAARCGLRVLPAFVPAQAKPPERRAAELRAASACCLMAVQASIDGESLHQQLVEQADDALDGPVDWTTGSPAKQCVLLAAKAAGATDSSSLSTFVRSVVAPYGEVAERYHVYDLFDVAASDDLLELERLSLGESGPPGRKVPARYFARPLLDQLGTLPEAWRPAVEAWGRLLESAGLARVHQLYMRMSRGTVLDRKEVVVIIEEWIGGKEVPTAANEGEVEEETPADSQPAPAPAASNDAPDPTSPPASAPASPATGAAASGSAVNPWDSRGSGSCSIRRLTRSPRHRGIDNPRRWVIRHSQRHAGRVDALGPAAR